jgi:hypothetical protein
VQSQQVIHSKETIEESSIQSDLDMSVALRGFPASWKSIVAAINEVAPMTSVAIHDSALVNSDYDYFLTNVAALGKNSNSTKPSTVLMSGDVPVDLLDKVRGGLPKRGVVIVATTETQAEELEKSLPYRSFIHKEGFKVLLFKAL